MKTHPTPADLGARAAKRDDAIRAGYGTIIRFTSLALAKSFAARAHRTMMILLGDDERYWVAPASVAEALYRAGYDYAE